MTHFPGFPFETSEFDHGMRWLTITLALASVALLCFLGIEKGDDPANGETPR